MVALGNDFSLSRLLVNIGVGRLESIWLILVVTCFDSSPISSLSVARSVVVVELVIRSHFISGDRDTPDNFRMWKDLKQTCTWFGISTWPLELCEFWEMKQQKHKKRPEYSAAVRDLLGALSSAAICLWNHYRVPKLTAIVIEASNYLWYAYQ